MVSAFTTVQADPKPDPKAELNEDTRFYFGRILIAIGLLFFVGICSMVHETQLNQLTLQEMRRAVGTVRVFQNNEGRLPTYEELQNLPENGQRGYNIVAKSGVGGDERLEVPFPEGGWALTLWRGEFYDIYTSWDDHYSLMERDEPRDVLFYRSFWTFLVGLVISIALHRKLGAAQKASAAGANEPKIQKIP